MTLVSTLAHLCVVAILACLAIAFGTRMLCWLGLSTDGGLEEALYAAGLFFAVLGMVLFVFASFGWLRPSVLLVVLGGAALAAGKAWLQLPKLANAFLGEVRKLKDSPFMLAVFAVLAICVGTDALMAMAPLTGSDAMLYHFTAPMLEVGRRWEPLFWLSQSFYTGLGHTLIQMGMTLGCDGISTGLICLSGVLTAGSLFVLTRKLSGERWAWVAALTFLLTPMVFWQMSISGCPDMWVALYGVLALLALSRGVPRGGNNWLVLAGIFAGTAAGVKYTAWIIPGTVVVCCLYVSRSFGRSVRCGAWSLLAGVLPLVRNSWWTGDPFFPFLTRRLSPGRFNPYSLKAILDDLHPVDSSSTLRGLLTYPFVFPVNSGAYGGFGHFFGPIVLAFVPLLVFAVRKNTLSATASVLWAAVLLTNEMTAQQPRYLLPAFPLALALVLAGAAEAFRKGWRTIQAVVVSSLVAFFIFAVGSEALYAKDFLPSVLGLEQRETFLERMAPDYPAVSFINRSLRSNGGKVLVFFLRVYYLRMPFEIGDPRVSWLVNPDKLSEPHALLQFLHGENIRWVVKAPDYPTALAPAFHALEDEGKLRPAFSSDVSTFTGFRMYGERVPVHVAILEVASTD